MAAQQQLFQPDREIQETLTLVKVIIAKFRKSPAHEGFESVTCRHGEPPDLRLQVVRSDGPLLAAFKFQLQIDVMILHRMRKCLTINGDAQNFGLIILRFTAQEGATGFERILEHERRCRKSNAV